MEFQFRQIKKPVFEIGDQVEYRHAIQNLGEICALIAAKIVAIDGNNYRISIAHGTQGSPRNTEVHVASNLLTQLMQVPNPRWLEYQLEKASKFSYANWRGEYLYDEFSEQYFEFFEEFSEWYEDNEIDEDDVPNYCFGTKAQVFNIESAEDQVEYWFDEDENMDYDDFEGLTELQSAINNFNSMNRKKVYYSDYSIMINFED